MCKKIFTFVGYSLIGEAVYVSRLGDICIEKDHDVLVEANAVEIEEIKSRMSFLPNVTSGEVPGDGGISWGHDHSQPIGKEG